MIFKVNSNKRCGLYVRQRENRYVTEYVTKYGWSEYCIGKKVLYSHKTNMPFGRAVLHDHDFYELSICLDCADASLYTDESAIKLSPGHVILIKQQSLHMYKAIGSEARRDFYCFNFRKDIPFPVESLEAAMDFLDQGSSNINCFIMNKKELEEVERLVRSIERVLKEDTKYSEGFALTYIFEMFLILSNHRVADTQLTAPEMPEFIRDVKQYIDKNFTSISTASEVAISSHYSREYISRSFKKYVNIPIYEYIILKKILNVCELIRKGQSIEVAAINSGFNNLSSFNRHFKRIRRVTPSEYKRLNQPKNGAEGE